MTAAARESGLFCVQVAEDDLKWMSGEQVRDAYRLAIIDHSTMVYQQGAPSWRPLRETNALGSSSASRARPSSPAGYYVEVAPGEVKRLTLERIHDAYRLGIVDGSTQVYCENRREWRNLEDMGHLVQALAPEAEAEAEPSFYVQVSPGDVKHMSLEQLDDAYRLDIIDESTLVWRDGDTAWQALRVVIAQDGAQEDPQEFYVQLAPDEVKHMSLEQLDDAYRLDIIDESTLVWRDGLTSWHSLGELAGIAPAAAVAAAGMQGPRDGSARSASAATATVAAPVRLVPEQAASEQDLAALAIEAPPRTSPWFGRALLLAACAAGVVTAHRNGALFDAADAFHQGEQLARLEAITLGPPNVDTPRGIELFLGSQTASHGLDALSRTDPIPGPEQRAAADSDEDGTRQTEEENASESAATARESSTSPRARARQGGAASERAPRSLAESFRRTTGAETGKASNTRQPTRSAPPPTHRATPKREEKPRDISKASVGVVGGDPNDPMNAAL